MPRMTKRHPEHPRLVAARLRLPRGRTLEIVDLSFFSWRVVHYADRQLRYARPQMADVALHRIVAAGVAVALHKVLIDQLSAVAGRDRIGNFLLVGGRNKWAAGRTDLWISCAGLWRWVGGRFGTLWLCLLRTATDRVAMNSGFPGYSALRPAECHQRTNSFSCHHVQASRHEVRSGKKSRNLPRESSA